jgi:hypothetical protein
MNNASVALSPETVLGEMKKNGVSLPDSETNWRKPFARPWVKRSGAQFSAALTHFRVARAH